MVMNESVEEERLDATSDTGPIHSTDQQALDRAYDLFYGTSPLSSACPTPTSLHSTALDLTAANAALANPSTAMKRKDAPMPDKQAERASGEAPGLSKKRRDKAKSKQLRRARRQRERLEDPESARMPERAAAAKHIDPDEEEPTPYSAANIPSASTGYIALPDEKGRVYALEELMGRGFRVVKWDGR